MPSTNLYDILSSATDNDSESNATPASRPSSPSTSYPYSMPTRVMSWADEAEEEEETKKAAAAVAEANPDTVATENKVTKETDRWETLGKARREHQVPDFSADGSGDYMDEEMDGDDEEFEESYSEDGPVEEYVAEEYYNSDDDMMIPVDDQGEEITEGYIDDVPLTTSSEDYTTSAGHRDAIELAQVELRTYPKSEPAPATDIWETFTANLPAPSSPARPMTAAIPESITNTQRSETPDELKGMESVARYWWSKPVTDTPVADSWNEYVARFPEHCKKIGMRPVTPDGNQSRNPEDEEIDTTEASNDSSMEEQPEPQVVETGDDATEQVLESSHSEELPTEPIVEPVALPTAEPAEDKESSEDFKTHIPVTEPVELPASLNASTEEVKLSGRASDSWNDFVAQTPVVWATEPAAVAADDTANVFESSASSPPPGTLPRASTASASVATLDCNSAATPAPATAPATPAKENVWVPSSPPEPEITSPPLHEIVERLKKPSIFTLDGQRDQSPALTPSRSTATKLTLSRLDEVDEEKHKVTAGAEEIETVPDNHTQRSQSSPKIFGRHASARRELAKASNEAMMQTTEPSQITGVVTMTVDVKNRQVVPTERSRKSKRMTKRARKAAAVAEVSLPSTDMQTTAESTTDAEDLQASSDLAPEESIIADSDVTMVATPIFEAELPEQAQFVQKNMFEVLNTVPSFEEPVNDTDDVVVNNTVPDEDDDDFIDAQETIGKPSVVSKEPDSQPKKNTKSRTKAQRRRAAEARAAQGLPTPGPSHSAIGNDTLSGGSALSSNQKALRRREQRNTSKPTINLAGRDATFITVTPTTTGGQATFDFGIKSDNTAHPIEKTMRARAENVLLGGIRVGGYTVPWALMLLVVGLLYGGWLIAQVVS